MSEETAAPPREAKYPVPLAVRLVVEAPPFIEKSPVVMVEEAFERKPLPKVARPVRFEVPEVVNVPMFADCAKRLVEEAMVEKKLVEVAFARVVLPATERVPVAVRFAEVRLPLKKPLPATESIAKGEVVPIPMR